ncbi:hypothetical protein Tco_0228004 [Tanacetum coccineum]
MVPCSSLFDTMADMNIPVDDVPVEQASAIAPPIRMDDQILPSCNWVPVEKSNYVLDVLKPQKIPISQDTMRDVLQITPTNDNDPFVAPPSSDTVIEFVNTLGYPCTLKNVSVMSVNSLYQPRRAILSMINMCLTGKTAGYDRPRHPVLQILWAARGKKKSTPMLIPSIRFTKLTIHYLKTKHNIYPRTNSPLHYSHDEIILGTLRSIRKDGRELFGMLILDALLTDEIKRAPYYGEYLEHVAKYQQYLDEECGKAGEGGVTESPKATKVTKPKDAKQTKPSTPKAAKVTKPADDKAPKHTSSQPHKSTPAPIEPSKKDQAVKVTKKRMLKSPLQLVDEFVIEGGPARPVVIREPDSRRIQPLLDVQGKGKEKVVDEQAAHDLLTLQTPKKKSPADQFIFQRRTPMPTEPSGHVESPSLDEELALTNSERKSDEEVSEINVGDQDEGSARPNPGEQDEGQAGSNPGDAAKSQPQSIHVVHAGPNLEHMDLEATDAPTQKNPEQIDEEFTTIAYPNVQENLKLPTEDQVILEDPTSSTGILSSLQNLNKELSFTNQFLVKKPQEEEPKKNNTELEV